LLAQRVAVAVVGVPVLFALILVGQWPYTIAAAIALAVATGEFAHLRYDWRSPVAIVSAAAVAAAAMAAGFDEVPWAITLAAVAVAGAATLVLADGSTGSARWFGEALVYVGVLGSTIVLLRGADNGRDWVYLALFSTFAVDTSAYFVGRAFGRHRMAPRISPKKTWEGFAGGWAGGFAAVVLLNYFLGIRVDALAVIPLALVLPLAATAGDLFESWLKRRAGMKDASDLIPGHGGVLDRLDSLLWTFPLVYLIALIA
jgi:phosphatidate cytidylyltransferase